MTLSQTRGTSINDVRHFLVIFDLPTMSDNIYPIKSDIWGIFWTSLPTLKLFMDVLYWYYLAFLIKNTLTTYKQTTNFATAGIFTFRIGCWIYQAKSKLESRISFALLWVTRWGRVAWICGLWIKSWFLISTIFLKKKTHFQK